MFFTDQMCVFWGTQFDDPCPKDWKWAKTRKARKQNSLIEFDLNRGDQMVLTSQPN